MSRIDQLISQYCPAGVPMVRLGEVCKILRGERVTKSEVLSEGAYPVMSGGVGYMGYLNRYNREADTITISQYGTAGYVSFQTARFWANDICYCLKESKQVCKMYLYHYLKLQQEYLYSIRNNDATPASMPAITLKAFEIPLPPLPVQEEIVRILDAMSDLVTNLDAEISARQKQYEHAREKLICQQNYEHVTFESLGEIVRGKRFVRNDITESGTPCIHYGDMYTYYGVSASKARTHLQGEIVSKMRYAKKNDVIIVGAGENNEDIGVALAWLGDQPAAVHDACYIISHEQNPVYISQYTRTGMYHEQLKKIVVDGKICSFPLKGLAQLSIPLPSLSVQQSIVERLDKMESLIQNLQAERDLRQKQYEYYREKLLLFAK